MKCIFKFLFATYLLCFWWTQSSAYELQDADNKIIWILETKVFSFIDDRWGQTAWMLLDKIDIIQTQEKTERVLALFEALWDSIEKKYNVWKYVVASIDTPVLYSSDFAAQFGWSDGVTLNYDTYWEIDAVEYVAFPGTVFSVEHEFSNNILKVTTDNYPVTNDLYIHKSFVSDTSRIKAESRVANLPAKEEILQNLRSIDGADYVWGGNSPEGIPKLLDLYVPAWNISFQTEKDWQLTGVDCSGLIYWATDGYTSRNTSWLVQDDNRLDIAWKTLTEITSMLEPLDVIVWRGHMMVVLDDEHTIESAVSFSDSSLKPWVQIRKISDSLWEVMQSKAPVNNYGDVAWGQFVVLRWYKWK